MKHILLLTCLFTGVSAFAQGPNGLIAHWDMDGGVTDVSGHGHNGHASFLTSTTDRFGHANKAYYFNGSTSVITAPYMPDLNLTNFSICAVVKVMGFYSGACQINSIIRRGHELTPGSFQLTFYDNPFDGDDCLAMDTTKDVFTINLGTNNPSSITAWQYTPAILENTWYNIVGTWDGSQYKIFVNGVLVNTVPSAGTTGTSTDSISIGQAIYDMPTFPYQFKGVMDDIRIYNRVLTDSETVHYGDTCGIITAQPATSTTNNGGTAVFTVHTSIVAPTYQWQQDMGTGFTNLSNSGPYSGVTTNTLTVTGVTTSLNSSHYRCIIANTWVCTDTTSSALLTVTHLNVNNVNNSDMVTIYPNPTSDKISVQVPYCNTPIELQVINSIGQIIAGESFTGSTCDISIGKLAAGVYTLKVKNTDFTVYKRILKN